MCILKRNVLEDLCRWMFPIVFEIEKRVGDLPDKSIMIDITVLRDNTRKIKVPEAR